MPATVLGFLPHIIMDLDCGRLEMGKPTIYMLAWMSFMIEDELAYPDGR
jgi:hypothetical protein